jgi:hypothetical protein
LIGLGSLQTNGLFKVRKSMTNRFKDSSPNMVDLKSR